MRFVIQRVTEASVKTGGQICGEIERGFLVLIGVGEGDDRQIADKMVNKLLKLRIFEDSAGKTNLALLDIGGSLLLVSQFTLYADCRKGNRPSFVHAGDPKRAEVLYDYVVDLCRQRVPLVETGVFGADMQVSLVNDGPFTIILDSRDL